MAALAITADGPISCRASVGNVAAADANSITLDGRDRTAPGFYNGFNIVANGEKKYLNGSLGGQSYSIDTSWATVPAVGTQYEIFPTQTTGLGEEWQLVVSQWTSAIGNGGGGAVLLQHKNADGSWTTVQQWSPVGTPGQNGNDGECVTYQQVHKIISTNTLRNPPRPGDGNLLEPPGSHTGTDLSPHDIGHEAAFFHDVPAPPNGSALRWFHDDARRADGSIVIFGGHHFRVKDSALGTAEWLLSPAGFNAFTFGDGIQQGNLPIIGAFAAVVFDGGTTPTIVRARNISSVSRLATGMYQINFTNPPASSDYVVSGSLRMSSGVGHFGIRDVSPLSTNCAIIQCVDSSGAPADPLTGHIAFTYP